VCGREEFREHFDGVRGQLELFKRAFESGLVGVREGVGGEDAGVRVGASGEVEAADDDAGGSEGGEVEGGEEEVFVVGDDCRTSSARESSALCAPS
jgi:hypothetical protein